MIIINELVDKNALTIADHLVEWHIEGEELSGGPLQESLKGWVLRPLDERPLPPGKSLIITLTGLKTDMPDGPTSCYCQVDMPLGQRNGRDVLVQKTLGPIIKSKTIVANDRVGIGTGKPGSTLDVHGGVRARGGSPGNYGSANNGFFFNGRGDTDSGMSSLEDGELAFFANNVKAVNIQEKDVTKDGQVDRQINMSVLGDLHIKKAEQGSSGGNLSLDGRMQDKTGDVMPVGSIIAFGGSKPPTGWLLCNGQSIASGDQFKELRTVVGGDRVPDLHDRFILGSGNFSQVGKKGGEATHTLSNSEMPSHTHNVTYYYIGLHRHGDYSESLLNIKNSWPDTSETSSAGGGQPHNNMPPYYKLTYIIKY